MPNDEPEAERLDIFHHMITLASGLHRAPIGPSPHKVLDLGTGTGIWAIEMGKLGEPDSIASRARDGLDRRLQVTNILRPW